MQSGRAAAHLGRLKKVVRNIYIIFFGKVYCVKMHSKSAITFVNLTTILFFLLGFISGAIKKICIYKKSAYIKKFKLICF